MRIKPCGKVDALRRLIAADDKCIFFAVLHREPGVKGETVELRREHHEVAERDVEVAESRRARQTVMRLARDIEDEFRAGRFPAVRRRDDHLAVMLRLGIVRADRIIRQQHDSAAVPYCGKRRVQRGKRR